MSGVTHAPEFGEYRSVKPVGGGMPISRFYIPDLHVRVRYADAMKIFLKKKWLDSVSSFYENICDCDECKKTLGNNPENFLKFGESETKSIQRKNGLVRIDFPTRDARMRCLRHYLQRKHREYQAVTKLKPDQLVANLQNGEDKFREVIGLDGIAHLTLWKLIISSYDFE